MADVSQCGQRLICVHHLREMCYLKEAEDLEKVPSSNLLGPDSLSGGYLAPPAWKHRSCSPGQVHEGHRLGVKHTSARVSLHPFTGLDN